MPLTAFEAQNADDVDPGWPPVAGGTAHSATARRRSASPDVQSTSRPHGSPAVDASTGTAAPPWSPRCSRNWSPRRARGPRRRTRCTWLPASGRWTRKSRGSSSCSPSAAASCNARDRWPRPPALLTRSRRCTGRRRCTSGPARGRRTCPREAAHALRRRDRGPAAAAAASAPDREAARRAAREARLRQRDAHAPTGERAGVARRPLLLPAGPRAADRPRRRARPRRDGVGPVARGHHVERGRHELAVRHDEERAQRLVRGRGPRGHAQRVRLRGADVGRDDDVEARRRRVREAVPPVGRHQQPARRPELGRARRRRGGDAGHAQVAAAAGGAGLHADAHERLRARRPQVPAVARQVLRHVRKQALATAARRALAVVGAAREQARVGVGGLRQRQAHAAAAQRGARQRVEHQRHVLGGVAGVHGPRPARVRHALRHDARAPSADRAPARAATPTGTRRPPGRTGLRAGRRRPTGTGPSRSRCRGRTPTSGYSQRPFTVEQAWPFGQSSSMAQSRKQAPRVASHVSPAREQSASASHSSTFVAGRGPKPHAPSAHVANVPNSATHWLLLLHEISHVASPPQVSRPALVHWLAELHGS